MNPKKNEQTAFFKLEDDKLLTFKFHSFLVNLCLLFVTEGSVNDETLLYLVLLIKKKLLTSSPAANSIERHNE